MTTKDPDAQPIRKNHAVGSERGKNACKQITNHVGLGFLSWTRATLVGGERFHHCVILAPHYQILWA